MKPFLLTKKEKQLILYLRNELQYGRCILIVHNGEPVRIEKPEKTIIFS